MGYYAKAIIAALIAGLTAVEIALVDDAITNVEWVRIFIAVAASLGFVWGVQNSPPPPNQGV